MHDAVFLSPGYQPNAVTNHTNGAEWQIIKSYRRNVRLLMIVRMDATVPSTSEDDVAVCYTTAPAAACFCFAMWNCGDQAPPSYSEIHIRRFFPQRAS